MGLSIGEIRARVHCRPRVAANNKVGKKASTHVVVPAHGRGRHVLWRNAHLYRCIRPAANGRVFESERQIDALYRARALQESDFWIFQHADAAAQRNDIVPLYEAVYRCGAHWVQAQKCHMLQAYSKAGRSQAERMWDTLDDGTPYWVDRYAFRKAKQRVVKQRYNSK